MAKHFVLMKQNTLHADAPLRFDEGYSSWSVASADTHPTQSILHRHSDLGRHAVMSHTFVTPGPDPAQPCRYPRWEI